MIKSYGQLNLIKHPIDTISLNQGIIFETRVLVRQFVAVFDKSGSVDARGRTIYARQTLPTPLQAPALPLPLSTHALFLPTSLLHNQSSHLKKF